MILCSDTSAVASRLPLFNIGFDPASTPVATGVSWLAGEAVERMFPGAAFLRQCGDWRIHAAGPWLLGVAAVPAGGAIEAATARLYDGLLASIGDHHLCRIWNFVPGINVIGPEGLENYQLFCRGRADAFERRWGASFTRELPAASAVGTDGGDLVVAFAASDRRPRHFENPLQVPAYQYPAEYGPRPPSFVRAVSVAAEAGATDVFISGTAAIRGHASVAPGDTLAQTVVSLENLSRIGAIAGLGKDLGANRCAARHIRVYLRHAEDLVVVQRALAGSLIHPADRVSFLRADICRPNLTFEIELTVIGLRAD